MRCLIVQNRLGLDGRSRCVVEFVRLLNELGSEPHIACLTYRDPDIGRAFGVDGLRYKLTRLIPWSRVPSAHNMEVLATHLLARRIIGELEPDLVFNLDSTWAFLPAGPRYVHYICYPFKAALRHISRYADRGIWSVYAKSVTFLVQDSPPPPRSQIVAISEFVRAAVIETHSLDVTVVFPPSWDGQLRQCRPGLRRVVTLGSFHPDKRQLEQVEVARRLPDWRFTLLGWEVFPSYARKVQQAARELTNVSVILNPTRQRIDDELARASHFVHSNPLEGFGIAVVEAVAAGCVPVVPDTGGVREIVAPEELRFEDVDGCVKALRGSAGEAGCRSLAAVQEGLVRFSAPAFRSAMRDIVTAPDPASDLRLARAGAAASTPAGIAAQREVRGPRV